MVVVFDDQQHPLDAHGPFDKAGAISEVLRLETMLRDRGLIGFSARAANHYGAADDTREPPTTDGASGAETNAYESAVTPIDHRRRTT